MKVLGFLSLAFLVSVGISSAKADWQYTKWGMDKYKLGQVAPPEADVGVPSTDIKLTDPTLHVDMVGKYQTGRYNFDAEYIFDDNGGLTSVHLELKQASDCNTLIGNLSNTYGPPAYTDRNAVYEIDKWWDKPNGNVVNVLMIGTQTCTLSYGALKQAGLSGGL